MTSSWLWNTPEGASTVRRYKKKIGVSVSLDCTVARKDSLFPRYGSAAGLALFLEVNDTLSFFHILLCHRGEPSVRDSMVSHVFHMMTSSNGNIFRVTGHLCGEFTGPRWIPRTKASDAELWCFLWSAPERLSKQSRGWWFETQSCSLCRHCSSYDEKDPYLIKTVTLDWFKKSFNRGIIPVVILCGTHCPSNVQWPPNGSFVCICYSIGSIKGIMWADRMKLKIQKVSYFTNICLTISIQVLNLPDFP